MAYSAIAFVAPNYRDYKNDWLKAYEPGTTTPKAMALDSGGVTQVAKLQLNADGFLVSAGDALVIPYIDGSYDLWLFPTEAEADANNTSNAIRLADDITAVSQASLDLILINDLSQTYNFPTVAKYKAFTTAFPEGKRVYLADRGAYFTVIAGTAGAGIYNLIASDQVSQSINLTHNGTVTPEQWGISDSATIEVDDSVGVQLLLDDSTVSRVNGDSDKLYYFGQVKSNPKSFTWDGGKFKFRRTDTLTNNYTWNDWITGAPSSTGHDYLIWITAPAIGDSGVLFKNIEVDGNGVEFAASAGYPNTFIQMFYIDGCKGVILDNVNIIDNNGSGVLFALSEECHFANGSITNTRMITGSITSFDQISVIASRNCHVTGGEFGGYCAWSCINTAGGWEDVVDGSEVGGFIPFNSPQGFNNSYNWFGIICGTTDTFHHISKNTCRSDVLDASQAFGGGVAGRMLTVNSPRCFVRDNVIYDTTDKAQAGLGFGHEEGSLSTPTYGRQATRTEASGNVIFGFGKAGQGFGVVNNGSEDVYLHDNEIYNCNTAVTHTRASTTSRYEDNWIYFNDISFSIGDFAAQAASHGILSLVKIIGNTCWNNLQDIITLDNTTYADLVIKGNDFEQVRSNALIQFDIFHGLLDWSDNKVLNNSSVTVADFFSRDTGRYVNFNSTTIECLQDAAANLVFFDGGSSDVIGRGRLTINDLVVDCPVGSNNRVLNSRRINTDGITISNPQLINCSITVQSKSGNVNIDGGFVRAQGTGHCMSLSLNDATAPKTIQVSNMLFPACGSSFPILTNISASAGQLIVNSCTTPENKEVTDRANAANMRNNNCWKVTAGVLTASRP